MRNSLLLTFLILSLLAMPSYAMVMEGVNLVLDPATSSVNHLTVAADVQYSVFSDSDSDTSDASGNIVMDLDYDFFGNPTAPGSYNAGLHSMDFTGGVYHLSDVNLDFNLALFVSASAASHDLAGTFNTLAPPAPVASGAASNKSFPTNLHEAIINQGTVDITAPVAVDPVDFAATPAHGTADGTGTIVTTFASKSGYTYTYDVVLQMPMAVNKADTANGVTYNIDVTGTIVARGQFTQTFMPGDVNHDLMVDGSDVTILAGNWQYGVGSTADATWEMGDLNGDGRVDASDITVLASHWQEGVDAGRMSVPEPGMLMLLLSGILGLVLVRRRR